MTDLISLLSHIDYDCFCAGILSLEGAASELDDTDTQTDTCMKAYNSPPSVSPVPAVFLIMEMIAPSPQSAWRLPTNSHKESILC